MNAAQIKYAKGRLETIFFEKTRSLPQYGYTAAERDKLFEEGRYSVEKRNGSYVIVWEDEDKFREDNTKKRAEIEQQYRRIMDEVILGDDEVAVSLIEQFKNN